MCKQFKETNIRPGGFPQYIFASELHLSTLYSKENLKGAPDLFICCGEQDRLVYPMGKEFAEEIAGKGYHCLYVGGTGDHEVDYWEDMMDPAFSFLAGIPAGSRNSILQLYS